MSGSVDRDTTFANIANACVTIRNPDGVRMLCAHVLVVRQRMVKTINLIY